MESLIKMEFGINLMKHRTETVQKNVNKTSDRVGDLIDDGLTERVYKDSIKNPKIRI